MELRRQVPRQCRDLLARLVGRSPVCSLHRESQTAQQARQLAELVALAHKAEQHVVDIERGVQILFRLLGRGKGLGFRGHDLAPDYCGALAGSSIQFGVARHRLCDRLHHPGQVIGEHVARVNQVVTPLTAKAFQFAESLHWLRHRRHGKGREVVQGQRPQVGRQEWWQKLGQVRFYRQRYHVAGVDFIRLRIHLEIHQRVAHWVVLVPSIEIQVHASCHPSISSNLKGNCLCCTPLPQFLIIALTLCIPDSQTVRR